MESALRAVLTGLIFHFVIGLITLSIWRLTSACGAWTDKCHNGPNPSDTFFEVVMIWPLYLVLLLALLIKSLVDLILKTGNCVLQFLKKWKGGRMKRKEIRKRKKTARIITKSELSDHHMLSGECEALDWLREKPKS